MDKLTLYEYIVLRINGKRRYNIVQDLIDDMKRDKELEGKAWYEIVWHIKIRACVGCLEALGLFLKSYKRYCKDHGYEADPVSMLDKRIDEAFEKSNS